MGCLSQRQLARLALGLADDAELATHLAQCDSCRAGLVAMQALRHELAEAHAKFDLGHEEARERLLAILPAANRMSEPARPWKRITHWMGGLSMTQRIAFLGGVGVAALLGFLLLWGAVDTQPVSAMEQMAAAIRKAKSYRCTGIEAKRKTRMTGYWLAPDSVRLDITDPSRWKGPGPEISNIVPGFNKPWININNRAKTFCRFPPRGKGFSPLERLDNFGKFSGNADRELGTKEISGRKARGFVIDTEKIDPDIPPQMMEIWIDDETNLPVLLRCDRRGSTTTETSDIRWNVDLDPKLFDPTPPEGYTDVTPKPPASDEEVRLIIEGLRTYADASGGYYPRVKRVDSTTSGDLIKMLGGGDVYLKEPTADALAAAKHAIKAFERIPEAKRGTASRAFQGIVQIGHIQVHNPDAAYNGKTVGPKDKDKVLLRWKLDDGRYEVIFGGLRAETVTAERLRTLEGK